MTRTSYTVDLRAPAQDVYDDPHPFLEHYRLRLIEALNDRFPADRYELEDYDPEAREQRLCIWDPDLDEYQELAGPEIDRFLDRIRDEAVAVASDDVDRDHDCATCGGSGGGPDPENQCWSCRGTGAVRSRGRPEPDGPSEPDEVQTYWP